MKQTQNFAALRKEVRTRLSNLLSSITDAVLKKKLADASKSAGFFIRHIADVELLFAKNVFKVTDVQVHAKTVIAKKDTGEWSNLTELLQYQQMALETLQEAIEGHRETFWEQIVTTKEFGTNTKSEALVRINTHTAYHAGQLAVIV